MKRSLEKLKITHKILTDTLDHEAKTGMRKPGCENGSFALTPASNRFGQHDQPWWEELTIIKGSLYEGEPGNEEKKLVAPAFARREPGHMHGPARTDEVCYMIEVNWYE